MFIQSRVSLTLIIQSKLRVVCSFADVFLFARRSHKVNFGKVAAVHIAGTSVARCMLQANQADRAPEED